MKKYLVSIHFETEVCADNEDEAITAMIDEMGIENDSLENHLEAKEIKE